MPFKGSKSITTVTITGTGAITSTNPINMAGGANNNNTVTTLIIGDDITGIGANAFSSCSSSITTLTLGSKVATIGDDAFCNCTGLTSLNVPASGVTTIGDRAFYNSPLTNVTIPSSVTSIGERAFYSSDGPFVLNSNPKLGSRVFPTASVTVTMNLTANGPVDGYYWTTFYNDYANGNFQADENTKVYKGTVSGSNIVLTEVSRNNTEFNRIVDAGTAVILKSTSSHPVMTMTGEESRDTHGNDLQGVMERTLTSTLGSGTPYVMGKVNDVFGFYQYTAEYMPAGKAYLMVSGSAAPGLKMVFDDETTSLTPVPSPKGEGSDYWYTLSGTRLNAKPTQKGVYIHNGRKVVVK